MTHLTSDVLESLLREYGWTFEVSGDNQWSTGFQGEQRLFPLTIKLSSTCVSFEVMPLVETSIEIASWPELSKELLELNSRMQLVKVAVTGDGEICLSCQALTAGFDLDSLTRILGILGYYADEIGPDLQARVAGSTHSERPAFLS